VVSHIFSPHLLSYIPTQIFLRLRHLLLLSMMMRFLFSTISLIIFFINYRNVSADRKLTLSQDGILQPSEDEADLDAFFGRDLWYSMHFSHPIIIEHCHNSKKSKKSHKSNKCKSRKSKSSSSKSSSKSGGKGKGSGGKGGDSKGGKGSSDEDNYGKGWSDSESASKGSSSISKGTGIASYTRSFPSTSTAANDKTKIVKVGVKTAKHVV